MPKRFADRDQTKCSLDGFFKPGCSKAVASKQSKRKKSPILKPPCRMVTMKNHDMSPKTFFMLSRASRRLKGPRSGTWQSYLFEKYFPK